jgi:hypothetical protein
MSENKKKSPEAAVREIKRQTRRKFTSEEKIRIVLEGLRGEESIATTDEVVLLRRENEDLKKILGEPYTYSHESSRSLQGSTNQSE